MKITGPHCLRGIAHSIDLRFTPYGRAVCTVWVINEDTGETVTAELWDKDAEKVAELPEGCEVEFTGMMRTREWVDADNVTHSREHMAVSGYKYRTQ